MTRNGTGQLVSFLGLCLVFVSHVLAVDLNWAYDDRPHYLGPEKWYTRYAECSHSRQSPIDVHIDLSMIKGDIFPELTTIGCRKFQWWNDEKYYAGLNWKYTRTADDICTAKGFADYAFELQHIDMHTPSEHTIKGSLMDAEIQFVYTANEGKKKMIIAVFLKVDSDPSTVPDAFVQQLIDGLGAEQGHGYVTLTSSYDDFINTKKRQWLNYQGSMTTPPCAEIVDWWISPNHVTITQAQLDFLKAKHGDLYRTFESVNNRPTQDVKGREIRPLSHDWGYTSTAGNVPPSYWHASYPQCESHAQSPIDIPYDGEMSALERITPDLTSWDCDSFVHHTDAGLYWTPKTPCAANGNQYELVEMRIHTPAEHKINGIQHPVEFQIFSKLKEGSDMKAISVFLKTGGGEDNELLEELFDSFEDSDEDDVKLDKAGSLQKFIKADERHWFNYHGSLTVPPCTEVVDWWVAAEPLVMMEYQLTQLLKYQTSLRSDEGKNSRPVQEINGRELKPLPHPWGYTPVNGYIEPNFWGTKYPACYGHEQSPIDIPYTDSLANFPESPHPAVDAASGCDEFKWYNDPDTANLEWKLKTLPEGTSCTAKGRADLDFDMSKILLHAPSEHKVNKESFDAEIQFIHETDGGSKYIYIGVLLKASGTVDSPFIEQLLDGLNGNEASGSITFTNKYADFIHAQEKNWFNYHGSQTKPPCLEIVDWWLSPEAEIISLSQLERIVELQQAYPKALDSKNNRPIQYIEGREIRPLLSEWAYHNHDGAIEPKFWSNEFEQCGFDRQSPINIPYTGDVDELDDIMPVLTVVQCYNFKWEFEPHVTKVKLQYVEAFDDECFGKGRGDFTYDLQQIQLHYPAEHSLNGKVFDAEIQFVHTANHGRDLMVVSVLLEVVTGQHSAYVQELLDAIGDGVTSKEGDVTFSQSHRDFVHASERKWFNYQGSMTSPPCFEIVDWWVSPKATGITQEQLDLLIEKNTVLTRSLDSFNNRPIQAIKGREVRPLDHQWAYSEMNGGLSPEYWSADYSQCGKHSQSPIDITFLGQGHNLIAPTLTVTGCADFEWFNDPAYTNLRWLYQEKDGDSCKAKGRSDSEFDLVEIKVHAPSEHKMNAKQYDGEMHFIHSAHGGSEVMVVGILLEVSGSTENTFIQEIIDSFSSGRHGFVKYENSYADFIHADTRDWFNYQGSSTTPPCKENVDWWISPEPAVITKAQLEFIQSKQAAFPRTSYTRNNRPIQDINGREIRPLSHAWAYNEENGALPPKYWNLNDHACAGHDQSPIDIPYLSRYDALPDIHPSVSVSGCKDFEWHNDPKNTGLKWLHKEKTGDSCKAKGVEDLDFDLLQFNLHSPSEHKINERSYDAEIQFIHAAHGGSKLMNIGILLEISGDTDNAFVKELLDGIIQDETYGSVTLTTAYDDFIDANGLKWFNYHGGLTAPPCSEIVDWWVSAKPLHISQHQYDEIIHMQLAFMRSDHSKNNRPVQSLNGRVVRPLTHQWAYNDVNGALAPTHWLNDYPKCGMDDQSPIDLPWTGPLADLDQITPTVSVTQCKTFSWEKKVDSTNLKWKHKETTGDSCIAVGYGATTFELVEFGIHSPSEHHVNGQAFSGEIQFVHTAKDGSNKRMNVGIFLEVVSGQADNEFIKELFDNIKEAHANEGSVTLVSSYEDFMDATHRHWFNYHGSQTTPPCLEIVDWWVSPEPVKISKNQHNFLIYELAGFIRTDDSKNNRPIQERHGRRILPLSKVYAYHQIDGALPPENWSNDYPSCGKDMQSPIDIPYTKYLDDLPKISPQLHVKGCVDFEWFNDPSYANLKWVHKQTAGDSCKVKGKADNDFSLSHFQIHTPSEHTVNGRIYDAELQFVHTAHKGSDSMVVSILIDVYGINEDPFLKEIIGKIGEGKHAPVSFFNHYEDFIDATHRHWFNYQGSLTSPPCTEMVDWWVAPEPVHLTIHQMELLIAKQLAFPRAFRSMNSRPLQSLNGREIRPMDHAWAYHGENGGLPPQYWSNDYPHCGHHQQSPIDIPYTAAIDVMPSIYPTFKVDGCVRFEWFNDPASTDLKWVHSYKDGDSCKVQGKSGNEFDLLHFYMHAPSEHKINAEAFDAEVHFVHSTNGGSSLMNIGVFLKVGYGSDDNAFIQELFDGIGEETHGFIELEGKYKDFISKDDLTGLNRKWFNYQGSLTKPPCSEIVDWWVSPQPVIISRAQYDFLVAKHLSFPRTDTWRNSRPVQEIHGREIRPLKHEWAYHHHDGSMPPEKWIVEYPFCGLYSQSPIDIPYTGILDVLPVIAPTMHVTGCKNFEWYNDHHYTELKWSVNANETAGDSCKVKGTGDHAFDLVEFHMRLPSEHKVNGKSFDAEVQFVHVAHGGSEMVIIGVLLDIKASADDNPFIKELFEGIGSGEHGSVLLTEAYEDFIDADTRKWFNYHGSLTTPPCSEIVDWWLSPEPISITQSQYDFLLAKQLTMDRTEDSHNSRPLQEINGRTIRPLSHKWAYHHHDGALPPEKWYSSYHACGKSHQSPIDIPFNSRVSTLDEIHPALAVTGCKNFEWHNDPHYTHLKWLYKESSGDSCKAKGKADNAFDLLEFQLSSPSEHKINGKAFDGEIQFLHTAHGGKQLMAVSILLTVHGSEENAFIKELFDGIGSGDHGSVTLTEAYDDFIGTATRKWFNYQGSLTAPPCSEIVDWWVSPEPVSITQEQFDYMVSQQLAMERTDYGHNNRPVQHTNERYIRPLSNMWAYSGDGGALAPQFWPGKYAVCGHHHQSPIDIPYNGAIEDIPKFSFVLEDHGCKQFEWHNHEDQTDLKWTYVETAGDICTIRGSRVDKYILKQLEMHAPSEHKVNGKQFDAEIHFSFTGHGGTELVIVGILLEMSGTVDNPFIQELFNGIGTGHHGPVTLTESLEDFMGVKDKKWFNYDGSLTTPPCSEIVDWWLSPEAVHISRSQYDFLISKQLAYTRTDDYKNNRAIQDINGRVIRPLSNQWSYHGNNGLLGPEFWSTNYPACGDWHQSPLDIPFTQTLEYLEKIKPEVNQQYSTDEEHDYEPCSNLVWHNNPAHTDLKWKYKHMEGETCTAKGRDTLHEFDFLEIHMRAPSEHKVNGHLFAAEVHFRHTREGGLNLLDIAVLLEVSETESNPFIQELFDGIGSGLDGDMQLKENKIHDFIDINERHWFNYLGSQTVPPCTENVEWWISPEPTYISQEQLDFLISKQIAFQLTDLSKNNRPVQPINGREIRPMNHQWAYHHHDGSLPPEHWQDDAQYADCGKHGQSPINIPYTGSIDDLAEIHPTVTVTACKHFEWHNDPHYFSLEWSYKYTTGDSCKAKGLAASHDAHDAHRRLATDEGETYDLSKIQMHSPSEHEINGHLYDGEIHFVHSNSDGSKLMNIAVLLEVSGSTENAFIQELFDGIGSGTSGNFTLTGAYDDFISAGTRKWFNYHGSVTKPPCQEIVDWWISAKTVKITRSQLDFLLAKQAAMERTEYMQNNRPTQAINGREIKPLTHTWAYHHINGLAEPKSWHFMEDGHSCNVHSQSPIDIPFAGDLDALPKIWPLLKSNETLEMQYFADLDTQSALKWGILSENEAQYLTQGRDGNTYSLSDITAHSPSEHRRNGMLFDAEIQFLHTFYSDTMEPLAEVDNFAMKPASTSESAAETETHTSEVVVDATDDHAEDGHRRLASSSSPAPAPEGNTTVVAEHVYTSEKSLGISVFLEVHDDVDDNPYLKDLLAFGAEPKGTLTTSTSYQDFLSTDSHHWFSYIGSLTKPPCSDNVEWWVMAEPIWISRNQYDAINRKHGSMDRVSRYGNNRPVQKLVKTSTSETMHVYPMAKEESEDNGGDYGKGNTESSDSTGSTLLIIAIFVVGMLIMTVIVCLKKRQAMANQNKYSIHPADDK